MAKKKNSKTSPRNTRTKRTSPSRSGKPMPPPPPATLGTWVAAARPLTLGLALAPVLLGTAAAALQLTSWWDHWLRAVLCLAVALFLQIGVNYANDYSDGMRGTDAARLGPARLVGSGRAKPEMVRKVALFFLGLAAVTGLAVVIRGQSWWLLILGALALLAAWFYTGGKRPYGYAGLGELAVFVFFGLGAVAGTMYAQTGTVNVEAWLAGVCAGVFAAAVLHVNNLRDRIGDAASGKRTLAVILGESVSRLLYLAFMVIPFGILVFFVLFYPLAPYTYFALLAGVPAVIVVLWAKSAREYVLALKLTLLTAVLFALGLALALALDVRLGTELVI